MAEIPIIPNQWRCEVRAARTGASHTSG